MIGKHDSTSMVFSKLFFAHKFALADPPVPLFVADRCVHDQPAVEPVLNPIAANNDTGRVPLAGRLDPVFCRRLIKVVKRANTLATNRPAFRLIADLVLQAKRLITVLVDAILETTIAPRRDLPLKR